MNKSFFSTIIKRLIAFLAVLSLFFIFDAWLVLKKTKGVEVYDDLAKHLSVISADIIKLEYILDIYLIAGDYRPQRAQTIVAEADVLSKDVGLLSEPRFKNIIEKSTTLKTLSDAIFNDGQSIANDMARLGKASRDEALFIHNSIDTSAFLLSESIDRLKGYLAEERTLIVKKDRNLVFGVLIVSLIVMAIGGAALFSALLPAKDFLSSLKGLSGRGGLTLRENYPWDIGESAHALNEVLGAMEGVRKEAEKKVRDAQDESRRLVEGAESVGRVTLSVARTVSQFDVFRSAMNEAFATLGANFSAVYLKEGNLLKLKTSKGFSNTFFFKGEELSAIPVISLLPAGTFKPLVFGSIKEYPDVFMSELFETEGVKTLVAAPVFKDDSVTGFFSVGFKRERVITEKDEIFLVALSRNLAVALSRFEVFHREVSEKSFLDRILQQMPFGVAVFDKEGVCAMSNAMFGRYMGGESVTCDYVGNYRIFEDETILKSGMMPLIKRSYEGHPVEFTVDYQGTSYSKKAKKLRMRAWPLYLSGGDISHIVCLYEEYAADKARLTSQRGSGGSSASGGGGGFPAGGGI